MAAAKPLRAMRFDQLKIFTGTANPVLAGKICAALGCTIGAADVQTFSDGETHLQIQGKRPRIGRLHGSADLYAGRPQPHGIAADDRCRQARFGAKDHSGATILWVCAAGPEG